MNMHYKVFLIFSGIFGAASVALAAIGAHAFYELLFENQQVETFGKAVDYAMNGAVALLGVVAISHLFSNKWFILSGYLFIIGTFFFSGSLFVYTLAEVDSITRLTPVGGTTLIVAWLSLIIIALFCKKTGQY
ncbi:MAG: DUF423 domain-containing protein [Gammaproteobacteria bacterium]|nr:DUF423 domain-containing protein [Gammaproteobacteria bacterium]